VEGARAGLEHGRLNGIYADAERLGRVRQIGRLLRLRRVADLELDIVVLKTIAGDRSFDREIHVLRDVALSLYLVEEVQLR
jgi:hypothetical protein